MRSSFFAAVGAFGLLFGLSAHADVGATKSIVCTIDSISKEGIVQTNVKRVFDGLNEFSAKSEDIGNLNLKVGIGGSATLASGEKRLSFYVEILDKENGVLRAGEIALGPGSTAKASYQVEGTVEALSATCALGN